MSGINNDGPKGPNMGLIEELKQKQAVKNQQAAPVATVPVTKKVPVLPPVQGAVLTKHPVKVGTPAAPQQKMPVLPKQPVKQTAPVHQAKAAPKAMQAVQEQKMPVMPKQAVKQTVPKGAPKPMTGAERQNQLARELFNMEFKSLPLVFQGFISANLKNDNPKAKLESLVQRVRIDFVDQLMSLKSEIQAYDQNRSRVSAEVFGKAGAGNKVSAEAVESSDDSSDSDGPISVKAKASQMEPISGSIFGANCYEGGIKSKEFRNFFASFMQNMSDNSLDKYAGDLNESMNLMSYLAGSAASVSMDVSMAITKLSALANYINFIEQIRSFEGKGQENIEISINNRENSCDFLPAIPPQISELKNMTRLIIRFDNYKIDLVGGLILPETMLKLEKLKSVYLIGLSPIDGDENKVVQAMSAKGCKVKYGKWSNYLENKYDWVSHKMIGVLRKDFDADSSSESDSSSSSDSD